MRYTTPLLVWVCTGWLVGGTMTSPIAAQETRCAVLEVFVKGSSDRSAEAREFVEKTYGQKPGVKIAIRDVVDNSDNLDRYWKIAESFKIQNPGLPAFYVSGKFEYGWDAATTPQKIEELLTVEVFVRAGCPRCAQAKPIIFNQIAPNYPGYKFVEKEIINTPANNQRLHELANRYRQAATSVPALHYCGKLLIGFYDPNTSRKQWDDVLKAVTVPCTPSLAPAPKTETLKPEPQSQWIRPTPAKITPVGWFGSTAYAGEPPVPLADDTQHLAATIPPAIEPAVSNENADAPPPRPKRTIPDEVPAETEPVPAIDVPTQAAEPSDAVTLPVIGEVHWKAIGLPAFTFLVGLVDGFNPCAMWVLLFLLSLLVNLRDRWKILAVAGSFVFVSGAAYFAFMAAWLNVFQLIGLLRPAQIALGLMGIGVGMVHVKDFFAFKKGVSFSIPESAKPKLYERMRKIVMAESLWGAVIGASTLAVLVNIVELLCTAGLPAMYTGVLTMQNYPAWMNYLYLLLYIVAYMLDDTLMVAVVVATLGKHRLQESGGRVLKLVSGAVILAIGAVMLIKPEWLV